MSHELPRHSLSNPVTSYSLDSSTQNTSPSHQFAAQVFKRNFRESFGEDVPELFNSINLQQFDLALHNFLTKPYGLIVVVLVAISVKCVRKRYYRRNGSNSCIGCGGGEAARWSFRPIDYSYFTIGLSECDMNRPSSLWLLAFTNKTHFTVRAHHENNSW